ncbi:MAG: DegT/DnrJ/EryC1/StrS family aminotransferase [Candidatus Omnitrophica bacterium]|nr:DegT/DnrJ/EryC1/StrS family aminotransferase [Candidatus Omnitrophota bacterium]MCM8802149.1 DegT/DnrJ/EryC1/StrS family aminotransferase [Candidatus Omnitrophota bacterium]
MDKLVIDGGKPIRKKLFPQRIMFDEKEVKIITDMMKNATKENTAKYLDRYAGNQVDTYEKEFAKFFGTKYATATSSGTAAIHSAIASLDLEPGDRIITTPITDPGTVMPIIFQGLIPVFADVDYDTLNLTTETIEEKIDEKTKAIIVVHLAGVPCEMDKIMKLAKKYNLKVIEDCAQSHASIYKDKYVGTFGDIGAFSLMSGKHMTSGGQGGMIITDNEEYYWKAKRFADRGKPFGVENPEGNVCIGLNYRMTEIEAAIGRVQLKKIKRIAEKRFKIVEELRKGFKNLKGFSLWKRPKDSKPNYWFCFVKVEQERFKFDKWKLAGILSKEGLPVGAHYVIPMYENPFIKERKTFGTSEYPFKFYAPEITYKCPVAEKALNSHITLYFNEFWNKKDIEDTIKIFERVEKFCLR